MGLISYVSCPVVVRGAQLVTDIGGTRRDDKTHSDVDDISALGGTFCDTQVVVPVRGHHDSIHRLVEGDLYIGRGSPKRSQYCNNYEVAVCGRALGNWTFRRIFQPRPTDVRLPPEAVGQNVCEPLP